VEAVRRRRDRDGYLFLINHSNRSVRVPATGTDLLSGAPTNGTAELAAGGVAVIREHLSGTGPGTEPGPGPDSAS